MPYMVLSSENQSYTTDNIVQYGINLENIQEEGNPRFRRKTSIPCPLPCLIKTKVSYTISSIGESKPISIKALAIKTFPKETVRASYLLKIHSSNRIYAPSFGFVLPNPNLDNLMGTAMWPTLTNGRGITVYSFMSSKPRFYSNTNHGVADSELAFETPDKKSFNTVKIDIEYTNLGKSGDLVLEMNRDLYGYAGNTLTVLPGSSVTYDAW